MRNERTTHHADVRPLLAEEQGRGALHRLMRDPVVVLVIALTLVRVVYLLWLCPYELVEDEAHYWEWSRRLGLSYYTKGPGVAWVIAASTWIFGTTEFAVRLPSVLSSAIASLAIAGLARSAFEDRRAGFYAAAIFNLAPVFQFASILMTIDSPYIACWAVACRAGWGAMRGRSWTAAWWILLGAALGIGFLFKYTILLLVPGLVLGSWLAARTGGKSAARGERRGGHYAPGLALAMFAFLACASPVVIWNMQQGWPTIKHLMGHLGVAGGDVAVKPNDAGGWRYQPRWTLELIGVQFVMMGAVSAVIAGSLVWVAKRRITESARPEAIFLIGAAVPIFLFYIGVTGFTNAEGNWPVAGFVTLISLGGAWLSTGIRQHLLATGQEAAPGGARRKPFVTEAWKASVGAGIVIGVLMLRVDLLARLPVLGPLVPIGRLIGARTQTGHVEELSASLRQRASLEPFILVQHYGQASRLAFYLDGRPIVHCASSHTSGRKTQYDYWRDTDLDSPSLTGRPAVLIGGVQEQWEMAFDRVEHIGKLRGETKKDRQTFLGFGYKGFPPPPM